MSSSSARDRVVDHGFSVLQKWGIRIVVYAAAAVVLGWVIGHTWMVLYPLAMALVVATVLQPPTGFLRRHGWPDALAAVTVMLSFFALISALVALLAPQVAGQADDVAEGASDGLQQVREWLVTGPFEVTNGQITNAIGAVQDKIQDSATQIGSGVFSTIGVATSVIVNLVLILVLTFFFMKDGHKFLPWVRSIGGARVGGHLTELLTRIWNTLGGFIRAQTVVAAIDAVIIGLGLIILDVPLAVPLAVVTFFGGYIPIIGAFVSGALAVLVTLVTNGWQEALIALAIVVAVQQLEGNVLSPWLQGKSMNLHAGIILLSVTAGSSMFGITGAFLAVPAASAVAETLRYLLERVDREAGVVPEDAGPPLEEPGTPVAEQD